MYDQFNRKINYLRISITDRCNLRCRYCMPHDGIQLLNHKNILRFSEIEEVVKEATLLGINKFRITGGEPLVRNGIVELVEKITKIKGVDDLGMTTNAVLLEKYAKELANAGLHRVNISLDSVNRQKYTEITRRDELPQVLKGIDAALEAGLTPVKINCVIKENENEKDAKEVTQFCKEKKLQIRYIREMNLEDGEFWQVNGGDGGNCFICNRLRITSDGKIKPCLFSNLEFDIRKLGIKQALISAIEQKPKNGSINHHNHFNNIGG